MGDLQNVQPWMDALPLGDTNKKRPLGLNLPALLGPLTSLRPAMMPTGSEPRAETLPSSPSSQPRGEPLANTAPRPGTSLAVTPQPKPSLIDAARVEPHGGTVTPSTDGVSATNRDSMGTSRLNVSSTGDNGGVTPPAPGPASVATTSNPLAIQPQTLAPLSFKERQALPTTSPGAPAGSAASYQAQLERLEDQRANPWGSPENHPGLAGKVGHVLGRIGNTAGDIFAPRTMAIIPGTDLNRNVRESGLENRFETASVREDRVAAERVREAQTEEQRRIEERRNEILDRRNDILEGKQPKLTPDEGAIADLQKQPNPKTGKPYTAYEARVKLAQDIQDTKPAGRTSPFEAFTYGTPEEKKAAQDFLAFEKRMGAQYQKPTEAEFRYSLYQRDPEGYKAVFGDKAAAGDRAHAAKMLNFFQKQRNEISKNFMLGDDEKAQQLQEIDEMESPFKDAAGMGGAGGSGDRVNVVHPDGTPGTIPRSQLGAAKRKGYRVAQ